MASYHDSFYYNNANSLDKGLIVEAFEPDNGFMETFLSMDAIQEDNFDGTRSFDYGSRYNTKANINITVIKRDGTSLTVNEFRSYMKWLTGARVNSWLDMYSAGKYQYSFLCKCTNVEQYKLDARTVGLRITFSSVSPWAYSEENVVRFDFGQSLTVNDENVLQIKDTTTTPLSLDDTGVLHAGAMGNAFSFMYEGAIHIDNTSTQEIDNKTDDLYTYVNLDTTFNNGNSDYLSIKIDHILDNETFSEETYIKDMSINEQIKLSANQFITSNIPNKIFGEDFKFVWPRLTPGINKISISGSGDGEVIFKYRYPMKIGDNTMDVTTFGEGIDCGDSSNNNGNGNGEIFTGTIPWEKVTDTPTDIEGYGIEDAYTKGEVDEIIKDITVDGVYIDDAELTQMLEKAFG